jgi:hypothetical protein
MGNVRRFPALSEKWRANGKCGNCLSGVWLYNSASTDRRGKGRVRATRVCVYVLVRFTGSLTSWYTGGEKTTRHMFPLSGHIFGPNWRIFDLIWHLQYNSKLNRPGYSWAVCHFSPTATIYTDPCYCNCYVLVTSFSLSWVANRRCYLSFFFLFG